jgi:hypothetical protein
MKREIVSLGIASVAVLVSGCFGVPKFSPPVEPLSALNSRARCEEVMQRRKPASTMRALVEATLSRGNDEGQFRYAIVSRDSTSIRVDMLPPEGAVTLAILVVHDGVTTVVNTQERTFSAGNDEAALVERFFGVTGVSKDVVVALFSGVLPELFCDDVTAYDVAENSLLFLDRAKNLAWSINRSGVVRSVDVLNPTTSSVQVRAQLAAVSPEGLPTISLSVYEPYELRGSMATTRLTLNQPISEGLFEVSVPSDYQQVD